MAETATRSGLQLQRWELLVLSFEAVVASGVMMAAVAMGLPKIVPGGGGVPPAVGLAVGFFVLFWMLVPLMNGVSRWRRGRGLPMVWTLVTSTAGAVVGGLLFAFLG